MGSIHLAKTMMLSKDFFAKLEILDVYQERLGSISKEDAIAEGYPTVNDYLRAFRKINHLSDNDFYETLKTMVWVVKFKAVL